MRLLLVITFIFMGSPLLAAMPQAYPTKPAVLSAQDKVMLDRLETYLSDIHTVSAEFTQTSPSGDISSGTFYLERPGKLRMEYKPPTPVLMITSGSDIIYYDKELDQVTHIPLESTLVGFLARDEVKFDNTVIVTGIDKGPGVLHISLVQAKRPKDGQLTLEFADRPLILRNMIVTDGAGQITTVSLNNARFDAPLDKNLFIFKDPHLGKKSGIMQ